VISVRRCFS